LLPPAPADSAAPAALPPATPLTPCRIDNPAYKGIWVAPDIDNPEYKHDDKLYLQKDIKYVGFELWQVKSGTIFDNIIVTDSLEEAKKFAEATWGKTKDGEKEMFDKAKEVRSGADCAVLVGLGG
jgi:calreticulin